MNRGVRVITRVPGADRGVCDEAVVVVDDGTLFRLAADAFRLCGHEPQYGWLHDVAGGFEVEIRDESEEIAGIALQGPTSFAVLEAAGLGRLAGLKPFGVAAAEAGLTVSRTEIGRAHV